MINNGQLEKFYSTDFLLAKKKDGKQQSRCQYKVNHMGAGASQHKNAC